MSRLKEAIKALHARKDRSYRGAWKRRGERISILPNIARKVDRLEAFMQDGTQMPDEHALDTAIDLYVYTLKYLLFLGEQDTQVEKQLSLHEAVLPLSDHPSNFDQLIDQGNVTAETCLTIHLAISRISDFFEKLWRAGDGEQPLAARFHLARELSYVSGCLVSCVAIDYPNVAAAFEVAELGATATGATREG
jgi:hypothetical protein